MAPTALPAPALAPTLAPPPLLLTRPPPAARRFLLACEAARGGPVAAVLCPALAIHPVPVALHRAPAGLVLTSENGAARAGALGLAGLPAWCVGPRTTAAARGAGLAAVEAGADADALVARVLLERPPGPLLHLRGRHARGEVAARLRAGGIEADEAVAYRQEALEPAGEARAALDGPLPLVAPLFSPRTAAILASWRPRAPLHAVALSAAVAEALTGALPGVASVAVAPAPTGEAMVGATLGRLAALGGAA